jgi:alpha-tubulin suppressor-like RCC1 family protein
MAKCTRRQSNTDNSAITYNTVSHKEYKNKSKNVKISNSATKDDVSKTKMTKMTKNNDKESENLVVLFGSGDCGQIGMGEDLTVVSKPRLNEFFNDKEITSIAAGGLHTLALSKTGQVYSWGCNDEMALGHGKEEFFVGKVEGLDNITIVEIACGDSISAALSSEGKVYTWGTFRDSKGVIGSASFDDLNVN